MNFAKYKFNIKLFAGLLMVVCLAASCKKYLDVGAPKTELVTTVVFDDNATATNALVSIYGNMMASNNFISDYSSSYLGYASDEMKGPGNPVSPYFTNSLTAGGNDDFWSKGYNFIFQANSVIQGVQNSTKLADSTKNQLRGEALFIRAFCHFYMVNLFGNVPYIETTDFRINNLAVREPVAQVYTKILRDLLESRSLVKSIYVNGTNGSYPTAADVLRVRPNKAAVSAMIARVYLYMQNWQMAEQEATGLITNTMYSLPADLNSVFLVKSPEAIWQLMPSNPSFLNGYSGYNYIYAGGLLDVIKPSLSATLMSAFEPGDKRKTSWTGTSAPVIFPPAPGTPFAYKYKSSAMNTPTATEYYMVFRLAEQYLIRAEARAHQDNIQGAVDDLNILRKRARTTATDLPDYPSTISQDQCYQDVAHERLVELFTEWGHRWLDLKRTGKADVVLSVIKGTVNWQTTDQLFPIPQQQITLDPNMKDQQNPGYTQ